MKRPLTISAIRRGGPAAIMVLAIVLLVGPGVAYALSPTFAAPVKSAVGTGPRDVAVADFDRDGSPDVAVPNFGGTTVTVLYGDGAGKLGRRRNITVGSHPIALVAADLDRNGSPDLAVVNRDSNTVSVLLNDGAGVFAAGPPVTVGAKPYDIAVGDLDRDGRSDLAVVNYTGKSLSVLDGAGDGTFVATEYPLPGPPVSDRGARNVAIGDFDRDGAPDVAFATFFKADIGIPDNLGIWFGDGAGGFRLDQAAVAVPDGPLQIVADDADRDGVVEIGGVSWSQRTLWQAECSVGVPPHVIDVTEVKVFDDGVFPGGLAFGDFNNPRAVDAAVSLPLADKVEVLADNKDHLRYKEESSHAAGDRPGTMATADLDRDGALDLVAADFDGDTVAYLRRTVPRRSGLGFEPPELTPNVTEYPLARVVADDFTGDGAPDLVSGSWFFAGVGDGTFAAPTALAAGAPVAGGDLDRDGDLDLVSVDTAGDAAVVRLGAGDGTFGGPLALGAGDGPVHAAVGDINRDGRLDIVTVNQNGGNVSLLLGDGAGGFAAHVDTAVGASPRRVALGDVDRDGDLDVLTADNGAGTVSLLPNAGAGAFGPRVAVAVGAGPQSVAWGDFDRDGLPDLAAGRTPDQVTVVLATGAGTFGAPLSYTAPAGSRELAVTDIGTDGSLDLVAAGGGPGADPPEVSILAGDGLGGFSQPARANVQMFTAAAGGFAAADVDRDGVADLVVGGPDPGVAGEGCFWVALSDTSPPATSTPAIWPAPWESDGASPPTWWTRLAAGVALTAVDSGAGMGETRYRLDSDWKTGTAPSILAPTNHSNDGQYPLDYYSVDAIGNREDVTTEKTGVDTIRPTAADNAPKAWTNAPRTGVSFTAIDTGSGPFPLLIVQAENVSLIGSELVVGAPYDHTNDGSHRIDYWSFDIAGNQSLKNTCWVRVDTRRPETRALADVRIPYHGYATLPYKVTDLSPNGGTARATVVIKNSAGKVVRTTNIRRAVKVNVKKTYRFWCGLKRGTYRYYVLATDTAGNQQLRTWTKRLIVR